MVQFRKKMGRFYGLISFEEALQRISSTSWIKPGTMSVPCSDSPGLIACSTVYSKSDVPGYHRSLVDGFAVNSGNCNDATETNPVKLKIIGIVQAGEMASHYAGAGECFEIYTGGRLPPGCDTVLMVEDVERETGFIIFSRGPEPWENVERAGDDLHAGTEIVRGSSIIRPWQAAAMISSGIPEVGVFRKLRLGIISTGNELFRESENFIENTNQIMLASYFRRSFVSTEAIGILHDNQQEISGKITESIQIYDALIITGGTSLGGRDEVPDAISRIGKVIFGGVMMRPGRTIALYEVNGKPIFSVSGNPVPALISVEEFLERYIETVIGITGLRRKVMAKLSCSVTNRAGYTTILRVRVRNSEDGMIAEPIVSHGTGKLSTMIGADGTMVIPGNVEGYDKDQIIEIKFFGDSN